MSLLIENEKIQQSGQTEQTANIAEDNAANSIQSTQELQINSIEGRADIPAQLFVYNISKNTTEEQLKHHFTQSGSVISVFVPQSKGYNRGFGFITMKNKEQAENAKKILDWTELNLYKIEMWIIKNNSNLITSENSQSLSIEQIFDSNQQTEEENTLQFNKNLILLKKENIYNILLQFNSDTFASISSKLNDHSTHFEIFLLDTIDFISELNSQELKLSDKQIDILRAYFFKAMKQSGLIQKIENLIRNRIKQEVENKISDYSQISIQLICIYFRLMRQQIIDKNLLKIFSKCISNEILILIQFIKADKEQYGENENNSNNQKIKIKIESITRTLKVLKNLLNDYNNQNYLISNTHIHIRLAPLIHLCCPPEIQCPSNMHMKLNTSLQFLQITLYDISLNYNELNNNIIYHLINFQNILLHLTTPIVSFASQYQLSQKQNQNNKQQIISYSPSLIIQSLDFLCTFISHDNNNYQYITSNSNLVSSLFKLIKYKINEYNFIDQQFEESKKIRLNCIKIFYIIQQYFDEQTMIQVCNEGYIRRLTNALTTNSENIADNNQEIVDILQNFTQFFRIIRYGKQNYPSFQPQPLIAKISEEQIEEEGGLEEIESQLISIKNEGWTLYTKEMILNFQTAW